MFVAWKFALYYLSWVACLFTRWDIKAAIDLDPSLGVFQLWRPLTSTLFTESYLSGFSVLALYLFFGGYGREMKKGTLHATLYFLLTCKN
jgi:hypothetical protein